MPIGSHQSKTSATVEWGTPQDTIDDLGGWESFALDPCAAIEQPTRTARQSYTILDDGLSKRWKGRVWLNHPYGDDTWLERMLAHGEGTSVTFARTETEAFFRYVWRGANAVLFQEGRMFFRVIEPFSQLKGRKTFLNGDRAPGNAGGPTCLAAYGQRDMDILAHCGIKGQFVPLRWDRAVAVKRVVESWVKELRAWLAEQDGPVEVQAIYRAFADHPKIAGNPNWKPKIRQSLQRGAGVRVSRGKWRKAK